MFLNRAPSTPSPSTQGRAGRTASSHHITEYFQQKQSLCLVSRLSQPPHAALLGLMGTGKPGDTGPSTELPGAAVESRGSKLLSGSMCRCAALVYRPTFFSITAQDRAHCR